MASLTTIFDRKVVNLQPGNYYRITVGNNGTINAANNTLTTTDISDIQISTPILNQVLQFNGSKWINATISSGGSATTALSALTSDVTISSPVNGQVLQFNGTRWVNATISSGGTSIISNFEIICTDWAAGVFVTPSGWTVTKVNSDTALQVTHNKGKTPLIWSGTNTASSPNLAIVPTATRNMQIDSSSQVTFLQVGTMTSFKLNVIFT